MASTPPTPPARDDRISRRDFDTYRAARSQASGEGRRNLLDDDVSFMNEVAEGIIDRDRKRMRTEVIRTVSFVCAIMSCLCAGSITSFSLYAPYFLTHLHYSQIQVNAVSIVAELAMYLPIPLFGYVCDRYSPRVLSMIATCLFGAGYLLAAFTYKSGPPAQFEKGGHGWPFGLMILAFVGIGSGTCSMYLAAVATCAKNFSNAKYRGFMLAVPIAAFGLSGMWLSQVGDRLLSEKLPDGRKGDVNVFKYFIFLAGLLIGVGTIASFALQIVNQAELIESRVEALEQSGLLNESQFFHNTYGAVGDDDDDASDVSDIEGLSQSLMLKKREEEEQLRKKKDWLLNYETRTFLGDRTMWLLAAGFFLVTGPSEAYLNNLGTIIPTLTPRHYFDLNSPPAGSASTHVSIIALASTFARLFTGTMSDLFAPPSQSTNPPSTHVTFSRLSLLIPSALILLLSFLNLALPFLTTANPPLFMLSSGLLGLGYGASFSLVPIIISVVWGVENFATNWGIVAVAPAGGAALWSVVYSIGYSRGVNPDDPFADGECRGYDCFGWWAWGCTASVFVAIVSWSFAWKTWRQRNVIV